MKDQPVVNVTVDRLAYGGDGIARLPDGQMIFIPGVIPGEQVSICVIEKKKKYARGEVREVIVPSDQRVAAHCPHFGDCGGCHYQHIRYEAQLQYKKQILLEQLRRIGHLDFAGEIEVFPSDLPYGYRNVMQFHPMRDGKLGLMKRYSNDVFALEICLLPEQLIQDNWGSLLIEEQTGITRVELRQNSAEELMIIFEGKGGEIPEISMDLPASVIHRCKNENIVLSGEDALTLWIKDKPFHLSAGSFFQVNDDIAEKLVSFVVSQVEKKSPHTVLDLYAGVGLFSRFLAPLTKELIAVESSPQACNDFAINLDEFEHVSLYQGTAEEVLPELMMKAELAVCDPPRAGLHEQVIEALVNCGVDTLLYVSCDPATLARDVQRLCEKRYSVEKVALFDMFPQTYHFETVVLLDVAKGK